MKDPKMRKDEDGVYICAIPDCSKPLAEITVKNMDPFCSTKCCHDFYGVQIQLPGRGHFVASIS